MVTFLSRLLSRPPANGMGIRLGGRHACLLLVVASLCGIWQQSQSMHSECQPPLTRVRCFRRAATPPHGLSEIPQGKSCAFRDKAYMRDGHLALLPASTTLRGWRSALQHPWPAPLPRRPRQVVGDGARPCTSKQAATRCVRYSTRGNGSYGYKINDNGRSALTTSLLLAAIEMEPALVQCNHLCTRTVRWNGGLRQLPKGPLCSRIYLICGPPTANYRSSRATARAITESMSSTAGKLLDLAKTRADWTTRQRHKTLVSESGPWANMGQVAMATLASIAVLAT